MLPVESQPANPANREYGRTTLIKKTTVATPSSNSVVPSSNSSSIREYSSQSLTKTTANSNDSDYQSYVDNLEKKFSNLHGPQKFLGQVAITCTVNKNGTVSDAKVSKSSQMPQIDTAALSAVKAAGPFGAMPKYRTKPVTVQVTFDGTSSNTTTHAVVKNF